MKQISDFRYTYGHYWQQRFIFSGIKHAFPYEDKKVFMKIREKSNSFFLFFESFRILFFIFSKLKKLLRNWMNLFLSRGKSLFGGMEGFRSCASEIAYVKRNWGARTMSIQKIYEPLHWAGRNTRWSALTRMTNDHSLEPGWTYHYFQHKVLNLTN